MKTNPLLLLTTALLFSGASLQANDNLCGGADDDQIIELPFINHGNAEEHSRHSANPAQPPVLQGMISDPLGMTAAPGKPAQPPVLQGLVTDPLGLPSPPSGPQNPAIAKLDQLDEASIIAILIGMLHGNDGDDTLQDFAMWSALTGDSLNGGNLWGDNGTDSLWTDMSTTVLTAPTSAPFTALGICGGNGNDSITGDGGDDFLPRLRHAVLLIYGEGGADSLYGGSGADTLVRRLAHFVAADRFTCDPLDEDSITGDSGTDTFRPSNRMARLQQVAFSLGVRSDVVYLSNVVVSGFWGGGGTDEIVGGDGADF